MKRKWPRLLWDYGLDPEKRFDAPALRLAYDVLHNRPDRIHRVLQLRAHHATFRQIAEICYRIWPDGRDDWRGNQLAGGALFEVADAFYRSSSRAV